MNLADRIQEVKNVNYDLHIALFGDIQTPGPSGWIWASTVTAFNEYPFFGSNATVSHQTRKHFNDIHLHTK
jgi:hypothetical protein